MDEIYIKRVVRDTDGKEYVFNVYPTKHGYIAESMDYKPFMVSGKDRYDLQANMEWLVVSQRLLAI